MNAIIQPHNQKPAAVWSSGGAAYEEISRQIASALAHCVVRLAPKSGERILDVATGTGWTSRLVAERGAIVTGVDIAAELLAAARMKARAHLRARLPGRRRRGAALRRRRLRRRRPRPSA